LDPVLLLFDGNELQEPFKGLKGHVLITSGKPLPLILPLLLPLFEKLFDPLDILSLNLFQF
jgi:hypothetical protein